MEKLRSTLAFGGILTAEALDYVLPFFEQESFRSLDYFLELGKVSNRLAFINWGIFRIYGIGHQGEEVTKYFFRTNQFMVDLESYYDNKPSENGIQAMTASDIFYITRSNWNKLNEEVPNLYVLSKSLTEATLLNKLKDNDFLNFGSAKEKYQEFLKRYPDLALKVPQQFIASYLKITPQSLSRIRKGLTVQK